MVATRRWCLVLPVKRLDVAKTRLGPPYVEQRRSLALAFALDTTVAALACPLVAGVQVVTDDREAAGDDGLNAALAHGAAVAAESHPGTAVGTVAADLPALRPAELAVLLTSAAQHARTFVRDADGTGTTLLLARPATDLGPMFGAGSAERHARSGAVEIAADRLPSLRRDVDTAADLDAAVALGVGPWTTRLLGDLGRRSQAG